MRKLYAVVMWALTAVIVDGDPHLGRVFDEGASVGLPFKPETVHLLADAA